MWANERSPSKMTVCLGGTTLFVLSQCPNGGSDANGLRGCAVAQMMYGFGDARAPLPESIALVEDIVSEFVTQMVPCLRVCLYASVRACLCTRACEYVACLSSCLSSCLRDCLRDCMRQYSCFLVCVFAVGCNLNLFGAGVW